MYVCKKVIDKKLYHDVAEWERYNCVFLAERGENNNLGKPDDAWVDHKGEIALSVPLTPTPGLITGSIDKIEKSF